MFSTPMTPDNAILEEILNFVSIFASNPYSSFFMIIFLLSCLLSFLRIKLLLYYMSMSMLMCNPATKNKCIFFSFIFVAVYLSVHKYYLKHNCLYQFRKITMTLTAIPQPCCVLQGRTFDTVFCNLYCLI